LITQPKSAKRPVRSGFLARVRIHENYRAFSMAAGGLRKITATCLRHLRRPRHALVCRLNDDLESVAPDEATLQNRLRRRLDPVRDSGCPQEGR